MRSVVMGRKVLTIRHNSAGDVVEVDWQTLPDVKLPTSKTNININTKKKLAEVLKD